MTSKELNSAIKRFAVNIKSGKLHPHSDEAKKEFTRLAGADSEMEYISKESVLILFVLNRRYQFINTTIFGPSDIKL